MALNFFAFLAHQCFETKGNSSRENIRQKAGAFEVKMAFSMLEYVT
jgi:hypothetical protein